MLSENVIMKEENITYSYNMILKVLQCPFIISLAFLIFKKFRYYAFNLINISVYPYDPKQCQNIDGKIYIFTLNPI